MLADVGGAVVVKDADATADVVGPIIEDWLAHPAKLDGDGAPRRAQSVTRTPPRRWRSGYWT